MGTKECGRAGTVDAADTVSTAATVNTDTDTGSDAATTAARLVGAASRPRVGPALTGEC
ncbi:MAG: hypothetical protein HOW71_08465 [Nonomuraea sp.]|nr:hypothetical protein [Nonomuraea sp.]